MDDELSALEQCQSKLKAAHQAVSVQLRQLRDCVKEIDDDLDDKALAENIEKVIMI